LVASQHARLSSSLGNPTTVLEVHVSPPSFVDVTVVSNRVFVPAALMFTKVLRTAMQSRLVGQDMTPVGFNNAVLARLTMTFQWVPPSRVAISAAPLMAAQSEAFMQASA
jgi:hypothetical protein